MPRGGGPRAPEQGEAPRGEVERVEGAHLGLVEGEPEGAAVGEGVEAGGDEAGRLGPGQLPRDLVGVLAQGVGLGGRQPAPGAAGGGDDLLDHHADAVRVPHAGEGGPGLEAPQPLEVDRGAVLEEALLDVQLLLGRDVRPPILELVEGVIVVVAAGAAGVYLDRQFVESPLVAVAVAIAAGA